jgi:hypothetical protein
MVGRLTSMMEGLSEIQNRRRKTWDKVMLLKLWKGCRQRQLKLGL